MKLISLPGEYYETEHYTLAVYYADSMQTKHYYVKNQNEVEQLHRDLEWLSNRPDDLTVNDISKEFVSIPINFELFHYKYTSNYSKVQVEI